MSAFVMQSEPTQPQSLISHSRRSSPWISMSRSSMERIVTVGESN